MTFHIDNDQVDRLLQAEHGSIKVDEVVIDCDIKYFDLDKLFQAFDIPNIKTLTIEYIQGSVDDDEFNWPEGLTGIEEIYASESCCHDLPESAVNVKYLAIDRTNIEIIPKGYILLKEVSMSETYINELPMGIEEIVASNDFVLSEHRPALKDYCGIIDPGTLHLQTSLERLVVWGPEEVHIPDTLENLRHLVVPNIASIPDVIKDQLETLEVGSYNNLPKNFKNLKELSIMKRYDPSIELPEAPLLERLTVFSIKKYLSKDDLKIKYPNLK